MRSLKGNENKNGNYQGKPGITKAPLKTLLVVLNPLIPLCN